MAYKVEEGKYRHYVGSGILIDKDILLTAGHCLYIKEYGPAVDLKFYPGRHGNIAENIFSSKKFFLPKEWQENQDEDHDLGLIVLDREHKTKSYSSLNVLSDDELLNLLVRISGYPGDKRDHNGLPYMYTMHGPIVTVKRNKIYYRIDTSGGQSGSGVLIEGDFQQNINRCIGIHVTGCAEEGNGAIRINREKVESIETWLKHR
jgi:glutamyl endopeptidase